MGDNSINREYGEYGEAFPSDKETVLNTALPIEGPPLASPRGVAIPSSLINKHEHVCIGDYVGNMVHICSPECFVSFQGSCGDTFPAEVEALECTRKGCN